MLDLDGHGHAGHEILEVVAVLVEALLGLGGEGALEQELARLGPQQLPVVGEDTPHHLHVRLGRRVDALPPVRLDVLVPVALVAVLQLAAPGPPSDSAVNVASPRNVMSERRACMSGCFCSSNVMLSDPIPSGSTMCFCRNSSADNPLARSISREHQSRFGPYAQLVPGSKRSGYLKFWSRLS